MPAVVHRGLTAQVARVWQRGVHVCLVRSLLPHQHLRDGALRLGRRRGGGGEREPAAERGTNRGATSEERGRRAEESAKEHVGAGVGVQRDGLTGGLDRRSAVGATTSSRQQRPQQQAATTYAYGARCAVQLYDLKSSSPFVRHRHIVCIVIVI